ncbi:MAG: hypothetical protein ABIV28_01825 [Longimicrobiales bacterium]
MSAIRRSVFFLVVALVLPVHAAAQTGGSRPPAQVPVGDTLMVADTVPKEDHVARNAFARALILPGWGHFGLGATRRGMVFVALEGTSWFMLVKTLTKLNQAQNKADGFEAVASDSLNILMAGDTAKARILADPDAFEAALAANPQVIASRNLVGSRKEQRQDWITYTLFFTMASAVDAYVAANLRDFPVDVSALPRRDGSFAISFSLPMGKVGGPAASARSDGRSTR